MENELFAQKEITRVFLSYCFCQIKEVVGMIVIPKGFCLDLNVYWMLVRRNITLLFFLSHLIKDPF